MGRLNEVLDREETLAIEGAAEHAGIRPQVRGDVIRHLGGESGGLRVTDHDLDRLGLPQRKGLWQHATGGEATTAGKALRIDDHQRNERDVIADHKQPEHRAQQHEQDRQRAKQ